MVNDDPSARTSNPNIYCPCGVLESIEHGCEVTYRRVKAERDEAKAEASTWLDHSEMAERERDRLRAALTELLACKVLREKIDGELSACHQEMSPQLQEMENEYQLRKPLAWRDARAALSGEPPVRSRSVQRREAAMRGEPAPDFSHETPDAPSVATQVTVAPQVALQPYTNPQPMEGAFVVTIGGPAPLYTANTPICHKCGQIDIRIPRMGIYHVCPPEKASGEPRG